jgi:hypothetical protein
MKRKSLIVIVLIVFSFGLKATETIHDFFVSITELNYNSESKTFQISIKLFSEDFEKALAESGVPGVVFNKEDNDPKVDEYINRYINKHFALQVNGKDITFNYIGKKPEFDVTYLFIETEKVRNPEKVTITNTLLCSEFEEQTNMIQITFEEGGGVKSLLLNRRKPTDSVSK